MRRRDLRLVVQEADLGEIRRALEPRHQVAGHGAAILVEHGDLTFFTSCVAANEKISIWRIGGTNRIARLFGSRQIASNSLMISVRIRCHMAVYSSRIRVARTSSHEQHRADRQQGQRVGHQHLGHVAGQKQRLQARPRSSAAGST